MNTNGNIYLYIKTKWMLRWISRRVTTIVIRKYKRKGGVSQKIQRRIDLKK